MGGMDRRSFLTGAVLTPLAARLPAPPVMVSGNYLVETFDLDGAFCAALERKADELFASVVEELERQARRGVR